MSTELFFFFSEMTSRPKHSYSHFTLIKLILRASLDGAFTFTLTAFTLCWQRVDEFIILDEVWQLWNNFPSCKVEFLYYVI